jgi:serine/threonine protein kinase
LPELLKIGRFDADSAPNMIAAGTAFLALEWVEGRPLSDLFDVGTKNEDLDRITADREALAWCLARDVGQALGDLHRSGSSHGDVKPDNVLVECDTGAIRATLVDLGLATPLALERPEGGTPRYLAPEIWTSPETNAAARDLWAFGLLLAETWRPELAALSPADLLNTLAEGDDRDHPLCRVVRALLSTTPERRPRAVWVTTEALVHAPRSEAERTRARQHALRRAYLASRQSELADVLRGVRTTISVGGLAGSWLEDAVLKLGEIRKLSSTEDDPLGERTLQDLDDVARQRFLVNLIGPSALGFPPLEPTSDEHLVLRLAELSQTTECERLTFASLGERHPPESPRSYSDTELAIELSHPMPNADVIDAAQRLAFQKQASNTLLTLLSQALRRRGELGSALAVLPERSGNLKLELTRAELLRRLGEPQDALTILAALEPTTDEEMSERLSILARLLLSSSSASCSSMSPPCSIGHLRACPRGCPRKSPRRSWRSSRRRGSFSWPS